MRGMLFAALITMALGSTSQAAQIYKWVDAQGITHFDAQPPVDQQAEAVNIQKSPPSSTPPPASTPDAAGAKLEAQAQQRAIDSQVRQKVAEQEAKRAEGCKIIRTNLAQLNNNPRVREQTEDGYKRLTQEERQERIAETRKALDDHCAD